MNAYKRLIFYKSMQAIRTCGYSILSCGKSSNGNFEVLYITLLLWVIKYIVLIIAFKTFLWKKLARMVRRYVLFLLHGTISKWICCWKTEKSTFQPEKFSSALYFVAKLHFTIFLVEIMKYLGGLFQLFSTPEKEWGNLKKYCNYFIENYFKRSRFFRLCISGLLCIPLRIHIVSQGLLLLLFSSKHRSGISSELKTI